jgi:predicted ThiF/HesA family dinucleotide-utilizing enzyme
MATLTPTLTLVSTDAFSHQPISISVTDSLSVVAPYTDLSRVAAVSGGTTILPATQAVVTYVYIKNTGTLSTNGNATTEEITVKHSSSEEVATIGAGEFMFLPLKASEGLILVGANVFAEYIYFSKA